MLVLTLQAGAVCAALAATGIIHAMLIVTRNVSDFEPTGVKTFNPWMA
jgi:toxin FitB